MAAGMSQDAGHRAARLAFATTTDRKNGGARRLPRREGRFLSNGAPRLARILDCVSWSMLPLGFSSVLQRGAERGQVA
jgi:hypothetical protein